MSRAQCEAKPYSASRYLIRPRKSPGFWNGLCYDKTLKESLVSEYKLFK